MTSLAIAGETKDTGRKWFHDHTYIDDDSFVDRYSENKRYNPMGLGLDAIVYEFDRTLNNWGMEAVEVQQKADFSNKEYSVFVVGKANLWRAVKKVIGRK